MLCFGCGKRLIILLFLQSFGISFVKCVTIKNITIYLLKTMKTKWISAFILALVTLAFVGCSKDDDAGQSGSIDAAVGTYRGKLDVTGQPDRFDQTITVSKVSEGRIKVVVGDASLNLPDREINVSNESNLFITAATISTGAQFIYDINERSLIYQARPVAEGEVLFTFEGNKQ